MAENKSKFTKPGSDERTEDKKRSRNRSRRQRPRNTRDVETVMNTTSSTNSSLVFPTDSASMQAWGNVITTPGQENFIENFNQMQHGYGITDIPANLKAGPYAKRSANAMLIDIVPYFGNAYTQTTWMSPLDTAALNLKQFIDTSFGTNTEYDPQDLMLYLMAVSSIFPLIAEIKRDLRLALTYQDNHYPQFVPQGLFALLQIHDNSAEMRYANGEGALHVAHELRSFIDELNQMINAFNALPMPPEIAHFGCNDDLFDHIYTDSPDTQTAQLYVFRNRSYWRYTEEHPSARGAMLYKVDLYQHSIEYKLLALSSALQRITTFRTNAAAMLQNLHNAYGSRTTVQVPLMDIGTMQPLDFVYDPNICTMIENMLICNEELTQFSAICADASAQTVNAHVWLQPGAPEQYFNLPLQFHKPYEQVTKEDIGWALRLHPSFINQHKFSAYSFGSAEPSQYSHVTCDGYTGFAFCVGVDVAMVSDSGTIDVYNFRTRKLNGGLDIAVLNDFSAAPILLDYSTDERDGQLYYTLTYYEAARDVEVTYRLEDLHMHWTYMTQMMWASTLRRDVLGTRNRS